MSEDSQNIDTACLDESYKDLNLELQGVLSVLAALQVSSNVF